MLDAGGPWLLLLNEMAGDSETFWKGAPISLGYPEKLMAGNVHQLIAGWPLRFSREQCSRPLVSAGAETVPLLCSLNSWRSGLEGGLKGRGGRDRLE